MFPIRPHHKRRADIHKSQWRGSSWNNLILKYCKQCHWFRICTRQYLHYRWLRPIQEWLCFCAVSIRVSSKVPARWYLQRWTDRPNSKFPNRKSRRLQSDNRRCPHQVLSGSAWYHWYYILCCQLWPYRWDDLRHPLPDSTKSLHHIRPELR